MAFGARVLCSLGVKVLLVTNAAGGVNPAYAPGDLVRIVDHLNLSGVNPLVGENDERLGPRFPDMSEAYDARLGALLDETAARLGVPLRARRVRLHARARRTRRPPRSACSALLGADLVGMSTVPEVIAARHMGVPVVGLSVVTNLAAGLARRPLSHEEVAETAGRVEDRLAAVVEGFLPAAVR